MFMFYTLILHHLATLLLFREFVLLANSFQKKNSYWTSHYFGTQNHNCNTSTDPSHWNMSYGVLAVFISMGFNMVDNLKNRFLYQTW